MRRASLFIACLCVVWCAAPTLGAVSWVNGMAPNWDQPYNYPDAFDATGAAPDPTPGLPGAPWDAWCVPASAAMLLGHWEDVQGRAGLADGSADGNQAPPNVYGGPLWPARNWHDRTADGTALRGTGGVEDLGWYMDTNNLGDPLLLNPAHNGTYYKDVAPGLNNFFAAVGNGVGQPADGLIAATLGVSGGFGALTVAQMVAILKGEVDANRTAIAHFNHWNLIGPGGPGQGAAGNDEESDFGFSEYAFGPFSGGDGGEEWNGEDGTTGLGHSVLVVGYQTNVAGAVTHLIVHDNWPTTVRNVAVPVGGQLVAITPVMPEPTTLALLGLGLWGFAGRPRRAQP